VASAAVAVSAATERVLKAFIIEPPVKSIEPPVKSDFSDCAIYLAVVKQARE